MVTSTQEWPAATMAREVFVDHMYLAIDSIKQKIKAYSVSPCFQLTEAHCLLDGPQISLSPVVLPRQW